jgi:hypothetical protein
MNDPSVWFHYPNVKRARWVVDGNGTLIWQDQGGQNHFWIGNGGQIGTQQLGDLNQRIEDRAYYWGQAHVANAVTDSRAAGYIEVAVKTGSSGGGDSNNGGYYLCRAYKSGVEQLTFGSRQLQLYIQNRGWFAAFAF